MGVAVAMASGSPSKGIRRGGKKRHRKAPPRLPAWRSRSRRRSSTVCHPGPPRPRFTPSSPAGAVRWRSCRRTPRPAGTCRLRNGPRSARAPSPSAISSATTRTGWGGLPLSYSPSTRSTARSGSILRGADNRWGAGTRRRSQPRRVRANLGLSRRNWAGMGRAVWEFAKGGNG